jgi:hypothetical protein
MTYHLFIDDERFPPDDGKNWNIVRTSDEAIGCVIMCGVPEFVSYDHDLGGDDTSMKFIWWMIDAYLDGKIDGFPVNYTVHSQNPVGARNIRELLDAFIRTEITHV